MKTENNQRSFLLRKIFGETENESINKTTFQNGKRNAKRRFLKAMLVMYTGSIATQNEPGIRSDEGAMEKLYMTLDKLLGDSGAYTAIDQIMQHYDIEKMSAKLGEISGDKIEYSEGSTYEAV